MALHCVAMRTISSGLVLLLLSGTSSAFFHPGVYKRWSSELLQGSYGQDRWFDGLRRGDYDGTHGRWAPRNVSGALCQVHDECDEPEHKQWKPMGQHGAPWSWLREESEDDPEFTAQKFYDKYVRGMLPVVIRGRVF